MGASRSFAATETIFVGLQAILTVLMVERSGTVGAAYAVAVTYGLYAPAMLLVSWALIGFSWSRETRKLILASAAFVATAFAMFFLASGLASVIGGGLLTLAGALFALRGLAIRLGDEDRAVRWLFRTPWGRLLLAGATSLGARGRLSPGG
jgi:K+ transporter